MKSVKPVPYSLSQWGGRTEILYLCPACACDLRLLGNIQNYCYKCGKKFNWNNLPKHCSEKFKDEYIEHETKYFNQEITYEEMKKWKEESFFKIYETACMKDRMEKE